MPRLRLTKSTARIFASSLLAVSLLVLCGLQLAAQDNASPEPTVSQAVRFAVSPPVRELAKLPQAKQYGLHEALPVRRIPKPDLGVAVDQVEQSTALAPTSNYTIGLDFLGVGNGFPGYTVPDAPPDTNMAVGDSQIVQWVNVSFAIFNKFDGTIQAGPILGSDLFTALGGPCVSNSGDIIAQWDNAAHRWLLAQNVFNGPPYYACVAVSTSANALGSYYLYQFPLGNGFPDYPKWGRWNTTWTQTMNNFGPGGSGFQGPEVCLYERAKLLAGTSARQVCFQLAADGDSLLPADIDSPTSPPSTECQFFIGSVADVTNHQLSLYSACIDWTRPSLAFMTGNHNSQLITVPTYSGPCNGAFGGDCVPQKGISDKLDSLGDRLMYRFAYDNDPVGGKQHWYVNHSVAASSRQSGVRWYEFQAPQITVTPLGITLFQSGTYAPDTNWRWMGSMAADIYNDILVGYSLSSSTVYPSIEVAGRLKNDGVGLGNLEAELSVIAGTGSQPDTSNRWGDYSAMRIDPDGCTFWYTTEYYMLTQLFDWSTQIANIRFAGCHNPAYDGYIELCKQTDPDYPVTGTFNFTLTAPFFSTGPIGVPVGLCSPPIRVPSGIVTINEAPQIGVGVENVTAYSYDQFGNYIDELDSWTPPEQTATVTVMPGGVNLETVATYTNYAAPPGTLKICKIAGSPSLVGKPFTFTATDGTTQHRDTVNAGPPPGGNCVIDGTWPVNDPVTVTETHIPPGVSVSNITVEPPDRGGPPNLNGGYVTVTIGSGFTEVDFTDTQDPPGACSGQSLITVDPVHNIGYVPIFTKSGNGDAQIEVVDLTVGVGNPLLATVPLSGSSRVLATTYNPNNNTMLAEAITGATGLSVYVINTSSPYNVLYQVPLTITFTGSIGGAILEDYPHNRAFVAGSTQVGILDTSQSPPVWIPGSVGTVVGTDSLAFNVATGILFVSADGTNQIIDTTQPLPLTALSFESHHFGQGQADDGVAFDKNTNILLMTEEALGQDDNNWAFNFADLHFDSTNGYWTANYHVIPGEGETSNHGEGPSGQAAINCSTHQGVVADETGENLKLIHLPPAPVPVTTPLDNHGDPCIDPGGGGPASVYTISGTVIPKGLVNGTPTQLYIAGDPNSLTVDPAHNFVYLMAYTFAGFQRPLFLVRMDLSSPVPGSSPVPHGAFSNGCTNTPWIPASAAIRMP